MSHFAVPKPKCCRLCTIHGFNTAMSLYSHTHTHTHTHTHMHTHAHTHMHTHTHTHAHTRTHTATPKPFASSSFFFADTFLNLTGVYPVEGRSVVIHQANRGENQPLITCSDNLRFYTVCRLPHHITIGALFHSLTPRAPTICGLLWYLGL